MFTYALQSILLNLICLETQRWKTFQSHLVETPSLDSGGLKLMLWFVYWEHFRKSCNIFFPLHKHYLLIQSHKLKSNSSYWLKCDKTWISSTDRNTLRDSKTFLLNSWWLKMSILFFSFDLFCWFCSKKLQGHWFIKHIFSFLFLCVFQNLKEFFSASKGSIK